MAQTVNELEAWLSFYESNGLTYFPLFGITNGVCRCKAGVKCGSNAGKHPRTKAWKGLPSQQPQPLDNVGISTDPLIVIDLDGDVGESALAEYPPTFTTSTGHGYHLWYRADPSKPIKSTVGWRHKVDVRAMGGLLVVPPSRHRSGGLYAHLRGNSIQPVPEDLLNALPERSARIRRIGHDVEVTQTTTHTLMVPMGNSLVRAMEDFDPDKGRNSTLFWVACRFYEAAATGLLGADVLEAIFDAAVRTGLTRTEVANTLDSASKSV